MEYGLLLIRKELWSQEEIRETCMHFTKWIQPSWRGYIRYDCDTVTFWKRQNYRRSKRIVIANGWGQREGWRAQSVFSTVNPLSPILWFWMHSLYICSHPQNLQQQEWTLDKLWPLGDMMWPTSAFHCERATGKVIVGGLYTCVGARGALEASVHLTHFSLNLVEMVEKKKVFKTLKSETQN